MINDFQTKVCEKKIKYKKVIYVKVLLKNFNFA